jgi:hypothetical protein
MTGTNDLLTWNFIDRMPIPHQLKRATPSRPKALLSRLRDGRHSAIDV